MGASSSESPYTLLLRLLPPTYKNTAQFNFPLHRAPAKVSLLLCLVHAPLLSPLFLFRRTGREPGSGSQGARQPGPHHRLPKHWPATTRGPGRAAGPLLEEALNLTSRSCCCCCCSRVWSNGSLAGLPFHSDKLCNRELNIQLKLQLQFQLKAPGSR